MWRSIRIVFLLISQVSFGQFNWTWTELDTMPFRTANNAVCEAIVGGVEYVYSFGGIDESKLYSGIHKRSFKYNVASDTWTEISPLPDTEAKIASAASFVKGKIYIIGGYHVYSNGSETSSSKVHIYNPLTDSYEADGASIPLAIDDHVQCVYKDSLIFVVTGWSNNGNKPNVQIYNPSLDQWQNGAFVPNNFNYTAFGASGFIIGDTLYYHGGAAGGSFAARRFMRKGYINPLDPTDITWSQMVDAPGNAGYRSACSGEGNNVFWVGGSPKSYNYNGIAYDGSGGVDPSARILQFNNNNYTYTDQIAEPHGVMDLRGIAKLPGGRWIIAGGMDTNQIVSNRTFLLQNIELGLDTNEESYSIKSNSDQFEILFNRPIEVVLITLDGKIVQRFEKNEKILINKEGKPSGIYLLLTDKTSIKLQF